MQQKQNLLVYTFAWSAFSKTLGQLAAPSFVLSNKLATDLPILINLIDQQQPDIVLGIAQTRHKSRQEKYAINNFHGKPLNEFGPDRYELELFSLPFWTNYRPGHTFCNYTAYKISDKFRNKPQLTFIHLNPKDNEALLSYIHDTVIIRL